MALTVTNTLRKFRTFDYVFDAAALALIFFIPAFSHLLSIPVYLFEPMRIILVIAMIHTNRKNAIILAVTMPLVSFVFSGHPVIIKSLVMSAELLTNVLLFFYFKKIIKNPFLVVFLSIIFSKLFYYLIKYILIRTVLLSSGLVSTPVFFQVLITCILSAYFLIYTGIIIRQRSITS
jgi:hypothetical protein